MSDDFGHVIHTAIWQEEASPDNPFAAAVCRCRGYDVFGDLLGQASYIDYLWLLFKGERPDAQTRTALELAAVALANPGPRDPAVHAAMATGATGTPAASTLMAAIAAGAGGSGGAREVLLAMELWHACGTDLDRWKTRLATPHANRPIFWPDTGHPPGFDPHGSSTPLPVMQALAAMAALPQNANVQWLAAHRSALEQACGHPLNLLGAIAALFVDLGLRPDEGEMLTLLWRLPGAAAHALEQKQRGFRQFPFFELALEQDPGPVTTHVTESA